MASGPVGLWIDWGNDGFGTGAYDDCTPLVTRATYSRGSSPEITGAAQAGQAVFTVRNPAGRFNPDNASGPLYGLLRDGAPVWWGMREDGTIAGSSTATVRGRFAGRVVEVVPLPQAGAGSSTPLAQIICEDPLALYGRIPVKLSDDCSPAPSPCVVGSVMGYNILTLAYDLPIGPTASGFRSYLSSYGSSGDFVASDPDGLSFYPYSGQHSRPVPGASACGPGIGCGGAWFFHNYGYADGTMPTGHADGGALVDPKVTLLPVGPGRATIWLSDMPGQTAQGTVELLSIETPVPSDPDFDIVTSLSTVALTTPSTTIVVPNDGHCLHSIEVHDSSVNQTTVGFGGWDWLAA